MTLEKVGLNEEQSEVVDTTSLSPQISGKMRYARFLCAGILPEILTSAKDDGIFSDAEKMLELIQQEPAFMSLIEGNLQKDGQFLLKAIEKSPEAFLWMQRGFSLETCPTEPALLEELALNAIAGCPDRFWDILDDARLTEQMKEKVLRRLPNHCFNHDVRDAKLRRPAMISYTTTSCYQREKRVRENSTQPFVFVG